MRDKELKADIKAIKDLLQNVLAELEEIKSSQDSIDERLCNFNLPGPSYRSYERDSNEL
jgi:hypothetical protein